MSNTIILNRIFTGDYLNEGSNLGHEVVNLFKSDNGEYYIYLMPYGAYPEGRKNDTVKAIYLTKAINRGCLEVIGVATGISSVFEPKKKFRQLAGKIKVTDGDENKVDEIKHLFKTLLNEDKLNQVKQELEFSEIEKLKSWLDTEQFLSMKPFDDNRKDEMKKIADSLYTLVDEIDKKDKQKNYSPLCKAICHRAAHIEQLCYIIENDVRYGGIRVNELFHDNTSEEYGSALYLTYKAEKILKPTKQTYIIANENYKINSKDVDVDYIIVNRARLATTALTSVFYENGKATKNTTEETEKQNYLNLSKNADEISVQGNVLTEYKPIPSTDNDFTFLTLIKKEYDELAFSNMFQYFFTHEKYKELIIDFFNKKKIRLSQVYTVKREYKNIDLLIIDNKNAIVIENKIRSGINGIKFNEDGTVAETQLEKYKKIVEGDFPNRDCSCFIFKPNYSVIIQNESSTYSIVNYSELAETFEKGLNYEVDSKTKVYFEDFVNALKMHSTKTDNRYEDIMRRRMQGIIDAKEK